MNAAIESDHQPRLSRELAQLLRQRRVAALGTVSGDGTPFVSMVPFAVEPLQGEIVLHVSRLAAHTANLAQQGRVSLLVTAAERDGETVHAPPRVTLLGAAQLLEAGGERRAAYLARFPEAEPMTAFADFSFCAIRPDAAQQVAGFGSARQLDSLQVQNLLKSFQGSEPGADQTVALGSSREEKSDRPRETSS